MKIIDFRHVIGANAVRFYLGRADLPCWHGDDWNDIPWELNAGPVYSRFIAAWCDVVFPEDGLVMTPRDLPEAAGICKLDMVERLSPCVVYAPPALCDRLENWPCPYNFSFLCGVDGVRRFYFGDPPPEGAKIHPWPADPEDEPPCPWEEAAEREEA